MHVHEVNIKMILKLYSVTENYYELPYIAAINNLIGSLFLILNQFLLFFKCLKPIYFIFQLESTSNYLSVEVVGLNLIHWLMIDGDYTKIMVSSSWKIIESYFIALLI